MAGEDTRVSTRVVDAKGFSREFPSAAGKFDEENRIDIPSSGEKLCFYLDHAHVDAPRVTVVNRGRTFECTLSLIGALSNISY